MAKKENTTAVKETAVKETAVKEIMKYRLEMPDGSVIEGTTSIREFQVNVAKGFQNTGFQVKVSDGNYSGNIMIIDYTKQKRI
jgi:hypothetical protein